MLFGDEEADELEAEQDADENENGSDTEQDDERAARDGLTEEAVLDRNE